MSDGISNSGEKSEVLYRRVTGATRPSEQSLGDAMHIIDGTSHYVEVKKANTPTVNQVRPVKFCPVVVHRPVLGDVWYVFSPIEIVDMALDKCRGQHTEDPLECFNFNFTHAVLETFEKSKCSSKDLLAKVEKAIHTSNSPHARRLKGLLDSHLTKVRQNVSDTKEEIRELLHA